ncbi:hypothetical protein A6M27_12015 [Acidithiobacillus thiooxidans]|uniref:Uncharacterized protein n=1 Tax=Acidithiobacillus thiooxidans TaxID=930 RepID=A0A1C2I6W9_ACITH|nr:hypothetical protein [Acidithiobacillus thiooxidans]OCX71718.1 hypothetical protein A6O24_15105 [Acidithiobacillus thiooxidans]OCX73031.1 hypothetical protein A6P07_09030 [Acidithiobacillus thiooxidans]OCX78876.1 hypothetical protein A6O26_17570 [Acidithiobacillus thiooxidans]OCX86692.1 hypothetical protein A6M27_12015 [Acidithiobacillus thiooxidans]OFC44915.1 hypothetical protein BAE47_10965 [Acidithiobacillus thiooxidans]
MKSFTVIMQPHVVAHYLTRRAMRRFPSMPDTGEAYLALFIGVLNTLQAAAASGGLKLLAYPLWWPIPAQMALDEDGRIAQGAGVTLDALFAWMKSFDPDIISNRQSLDDFWKELQGDDASTEPETKMENGTRLIGDFAQVPHGQKMQEYETNKMLYISAALDALSDNPEGEASEKQRIITWITSVYGGSEETWKRIIKVDDIITVKNEKREK